MDLKISHNSKKCTGELKITGSKSETNRLLILRALFSDFEIQNTSNSDDSKILEKALKSKEKIIDINAGKERFLLSKVNHFDFKKNLYG